MDYAEQKLASAVSFMRQGQAAQAKPVLLQLLQRGPAGFALCFYLGDCLAILGEYPRAIHYAARAAALQPGEVGAWQNYAMIAITAGDLQAAEEASRGWVRVLGWAEGNDKGADAARTLTYVLNRRTKFREAAEIAAGAIRRLPPDADFALKHAVAILGLGRSAEAAEIYERAIAACGEAPSLLEGRAMCLNYLPGGNPATVLAAHRAFGESVFREMGSVAAVTGRDARGTVIRVGLVSPDLRRHSVAYFVEAILRHADRARVDLFVYSTSSVEDEMTTKLRGHCGPDRWKRLDTRDPKAARDLIARDGIDLLIELSGLTQGHSQRVMALRPAAVQATFIGYPETTGNPAIDWRIVDGLTDPAGAETSCTERLVRMEGCFLCYSPPTDAPEVVVRPAAIDGAVTFGSFNALHKLNDPLLLLWARLLAKLPAARMVIKSPGLEEPSVREDFEARVRQARMPMDRLEILGKIKELGGAGGHLGAYAKIDVALDTFPYCGTTTTCEALWMGVPVVTRAGHAHASRVGVSLLTVAGLAELVAVNEDEYVDKARALAHDAARLASLRSGLRERVRTSGLCDGAGYAKRFEDAVARMVKGN